MTKRGFRHAPIRPTFDLSHFPPLTVECCHHNPSNKRKVLEIEKEGMRLRKREGTVDGEDVWNRECHAYLQGLRPALGCAVRWTQMAHVWDVWMVIVLLSTSIL